MVNVPLGVIVPLELTPTLMLPLPDKVPLGPTVIGAAPG